MKVQVFSYEYDLPDSRFYEPKRSINDLILGKEYIFSLSSTFSLKDNIYERTGWIADSYLISEIDNNIK